MKKRILLILLVVGVVTAGLAAYYRTTATADTPRFTTAAVARGDVVETVEATGTLEAVTTVQVGTQVSGTIQSLHADFNSQVKKGAVVARLDPSLLQAQVEQAEATIVRLEADVERARISVTDAEIKLRRARELFEKQLIPRTELETAESVERQAQASLKSALAQVTQSRGSLNQNRVNLSHTIITAPVDGIVISRNVDVGQTVAASMSAPTIFVIAKDLTQMKVSASINESDIGRINAGQPVTFKVDAYPNDTFTGRVAQVRLQPVVAQNVVSYTTIIDVPNPELKLKPGMTANVTVEIARQDNVIRVPSAALRFRPSPELLEQFGRGPGAPGQGPQAPGGQGASAGQQGEGRARPQGEGAQGERAARPQGEGQSGEGRARAAGEGQTQGQGPSRMRGEAQGQAPGGGRQAQGGGERRGPGGFTGGQGAGRQAQGGAPAQGQAAGGGQGFGQGRSGFGGGMRGQRVWVMRDGQLQSIRVEVGISDGSVTAITGGELTENTEVITGIVVASTATPQTASPFNPFQGRGGRGGGNNNQGGRGAPPARGGAGR